MRRVRQRRRRSKKTGLGAGRAGPWISLTFAGAGWSQNTINTVLADLRADMASRRIDLYLGDERRDGADLPIASIRISPGGRNAVGIRVEVSEGGTTRTVARVTALDAVPPDGRPLAIALTAGELLRVSWVQLALRQAAENAAAVTPPARAPTRTASAAGVSSAPRGTSGSSPNSAPGSSSSLAGSKAAPAAPAVKPPVIAPVPPTAAPPAPIAAVSQPPARPFVSQVGGPVVPAAAVARAASPPDDTSGLRVGVLVGAAVLAAPAGGTDNLPSAVGVAVRVAVTGQRLGWSAGVILPTQASLEFGDTLARERRIPLDVGGRAVWRGGRFVVGADVGLLLAWRRIEGVTLVRNSGSNGVEVGTRAGLTLSFGGAQFAPWVGVNAEFVPVPASISFAPTGSAGHAPYLWGGVAAGFRVGAWGASGGP